MNVLVTGASGFIGSNLCEWLGRRPDINVSTFERGNTDQELQELLREADFVYHLAGVMRPETEDELHTVNVGLTGRICHHLLNAGRAIPIVFPSSSQVALDNPYGRSKLQAEKVLKDYAQRGAARVSLYRLRNVFGKWARPNYTSVVATFCHNIARDLEIEIADPKRQIFLVYVDDVMRRFMGELNCLQVSGARYHGVEPISIVTLGQLAKLLRSFRKLEDDSALPDLSDAFVHKLYATYTTYCDGFLYALDQKCDNRGCLAEFVKSHHAGQLFVSSTEPGAIRGNHYHRTKTEKFLVLSGVAEIRFQHLVSGKTTSLTVTARPMRVVDIPPGYIHSIENAGPGELITLFWASEPFDPENPDTFAGEIQDGL